MLIYKQRYKPRTTREFTKSDLTVYDSAGNTALNALTIYGKSEVINGAITSAGEGWNTVDLGSLTWFVDPATETKPNACFYAQLPTHPQNPLSLLSSIYTPSTSPNYMREVDMSCSLGTDAYVYIVNSTYNNATPNAFKTAMNGVMLVYKEETPTNNIIAIKTDNGTGVNGTMATFSTGTPLRGITGGARDVMTWDGSAGTVTKKCAKVNASSLSWAWNATYNFWTTTSLQNIIKPSNRNAIQSFILTVLNYTPDTWANFGNINNTYAITIDGTLGIKDDNNYPSTTPPDFDFIYELATPTTQPLSSTENASIAGLRTFEPQTHAQNNAQTDMTVDYTIRVPTI